MPKQEDNQKDQDKEKKTPTEKAEVKEKKAEKVEEKPAKKAEKTEEAPEVKPKKAKIKRRLVQEGNVYVQASYNNTIVTITEPNGDVIAWGSAGSSGFKGARKSTPYAAQVAAENTAEKAKLYGFERAHIYVKGVGSGREQAVRGLVSSGIELLSINDVTSIPHNGCRKKKPRRN